MKVIPSRAGLALLAVAVPVAWAVPIAQAQRAGLPVITDGALIGYASKAYDKRAMMNQRVLLGLHHNVPVVVVFPCSDVCPQYTVRVIHYDIPLSQCAAVGGVELRVKVPRGVAAPWALFCVPKVLGTAAAAGALQPPRLEPRPDKPPR